MSFLHKNQPVGCSRAQRDHGSVRRRSARPCSGAGTCGGGPPTMSCTTASPVMNSCPGGSVDDQGDHHQRRRRRRLAVDSPARPGTGRLLFLRLAGEPRRARRHPQRRPDRARMAARSPSAPRSGSPPRLPLQVVALEPGRALVLRGSVPMGKVAPPYEFTWAFVLLPQPDGTTRLVVRERYEYTRRWAALIVQPAATRQLPDDPEDAPRHQVRAEHAPAAPIRHAAAGPADAPGLPIRSQPPGDATKDSAQPLLLKGTPR